MAQRDPGQLGELVELGAVDHRPPWTLGQCEVGGQLGVGQHHQVGPPQPASPAPARISFDVVAQGVLGVAHLIHRVDASVPLLPGLSVVGDLAALDLQGDHARALEHGDHVDLEVLGVVGDRCPAMSRSPGPH